MPAERAGVRTPRFLVYIIAYRVQYTATMFLVDVSLSMGKRRTVELQTSEGQSLSKEMSNLEWALQFVKLKIQEMVSMVSLLHYTSSPTHQIFNGRKTDQCGVIVFGSDGIQQQTCGFSYILSPTNRNQKYRQQR